MFKKMLQWWDHLVGTRSAPPTTEREKCATPTKQEGDPPDFELKKYELDRAHELELNNFAHALEVERLKILQLVNGGAFTVLVAFATSLVASPGWSPALAGLAGFSWMLGLGAAAWATQRQLDAQGKFNTAYRQRRNAVELRALSRNYDDGPVAFLLPPFDEERRPEKKTAAPESNAGDQKKEEDTKVEQPVTAHSYELAADKSFYEGKDAVGRVKNMAVASIVLFMVGGGLLAASLMLSVAGTPAATGDVIG